MQVSMRSFVGPVCVLTATPLCLAYAVGWLLGTPMNGTLWFAVCGWLGCAVWIWAGVVFASRWFWKGRRGTANSP